MRSHDPTDPEAGRSRGARSGGLLAASVFALVAMATTAGPVVAQSAATTQLLLLQAEGKRAPTVADVSLMRISARSGNADTARMALRMLGRLERPSLTSDILPGLRHSLPEVRIEAANALAQATQGIWAAPPAAGLGPANLLSSTQSALIARLDVETAPTVRAAICEALARLPYKTAADATRAETAIIGLGTRTTAVSDRLGVAKGLETFVRVQAAVRPASASVLSLLRQLAGIDRVTQGFDLSREARIRRLAVAALTTAGALDADAIAKAAEDPDAQVRHLAMRAIGITRQAAHKAQDGLADVSPFMRIDALRAMRARGNDAVCAEAINATADAEMNVALAAIDELSGCGDSTASIAVVARIAAETEDLAIVRGWHRQAHAIVALATAAPDQARALLAPYQSARIWQVRAYAARAATALGDRARLDALALDPEDRVANVALAALAQPTRRRFNTRPSALPSTTAAEVRRLSAPRARIAVRDVGTIDIALFTTEAPGTVLRFVRLAEEGYYNGLSFDRLSPDAIVQGGDKGSGAAAFPAKETGTWPHVRGSIGVMATDTNDAQFFVNLVDHPRFDHQLTVFAQVLNGTDVLDRLLEGDVIESITIVP